MNLSHGTFHFAKMKANLRPHAGWIAGRPVKPDAQTGSCANVME
jgi:hypothetical protein